LNNPQLQILTTPNQHNPITQPKTPILPLHLSHHPYYLKYQNKPPHYINPFSNLLNSQKLNQLYNTTK
uniref:Fe-Mn family superoxide dismutase n=1 Tax=Staphylococcus epidermidis TaxID=1282 RepID=UPI001C92C03C